jgi:hypothetical protein
MNLNRRNSYTLADINNDNDIDDNDNYTDNETDNPYTLTGADNIHILILIILILIPNLTLINDSNNITDMGAEADTDATDTGGDVVITICLYLCQEGSYGSN